MLTLDVPVVFSQVGFLLGFELAARLLSLCSVGSFQWDFARLLFFPYTTCASSSAICDKCKAGYVLTIAFGGESRLLVWKIIVQNLEAL